MKGSQLKRLKKLEKYYIDDYSYHGERDLDEIFKQCPEIAAARTNLQDHIIRYGSDPPRFYQYEEEESMRRFLWALRIDRRAQMLYGRLSKMLEDEVERRASERERKAKQELIENWEWRLGAPEREAKATVELEERKRKMEEERQERERKWEEERAARQQANAANQQPGGYDPYRWQSN